jgi:biotin carboxylase
MNEDQIYNFNWEDFGITTTNPQGTTTLTYYSPSNNLATLKADYSYGYTAISWQDEVNSDIKQMKRHMSDMQTEINNLRAENQMLRHSLKDFIKEMKEIIIKKTNNNE